MTRFVPDTTAAELRKLAFTPADLASDVERILAAVRAYGDAAVRELTEQFDGVKLESLRVPGQELEADAGAVEPGVIDALGVAVANVGAVADAQLRDPLLGKARLRSPLVEDREIIGIGGRSSQQLQHAGSNRGVQHRHRFVGDHKPWPQHDGPGDSHTLPLSTTQLVRVARHVFSGRCEVHRQQRFSQHLELACAGAVALPRTRRLGATAAAVLFVAVFPANIQMAVDWRYRSAVDQAIAYGRLPLQIPLVLWALAVRRGSGA